MADEREPPHDPKAELAVIGACLVDARQTLPLVSGVAIDDFFLTYHREAWAAILALFERRMPIDVVAVGDEIKARGMVQRFPDGWHRWASETAAAVTTVAHVEHWAGIVQAKATLRRLIELAAEIQGAAYSSQPVDSVLATAREGVAKLEVSGTQEGPERIGKLLAPALNEIEKRMVGTAPTFVPSGIAALDEILGGGFKPARLYLIGGRPGDGKSALARTATRNAACAGFPALMFSREMPNQETIEGHLSAVSGIPAFDISSARINVESFKLLQKHGGDSLYEAPLWLDDRSATIERICANTRRWHAMEVRKLGPKHLGIMVLDYLQLARLAKARSNANREQVVAEMSRAMKELAMELNIPVVVLSQLKREAEERGGRPIPSDLRESGALEQDGDVILFVYRDIPAEDKATRNQPGDAEIVIGKHRGGKTGIAKAYFETRLMHWRDRDRYEPPRDWQTRGEE